MNTEMTWYYATVGDDTPNAAAGKSGLVQSTLAAQLRRGRLAPESVVAIARAYGADAIKGLIAAGLISADDVRRYGTKEALHAATDAEIAEEVYRRLVAGTATDDLTDGQIGELHQNVRPDSEDTDYEQYAAGQTQDPVDSDFPD